ncbi:metal ABC transporter solute-binding protein, Zn/Mn family [Maridesulfovibrio hydrothermalis]|uniref:Periplasmic solute binding protein n=1 Tax=Maridesulfovibrio hydrothermalis AM13 = DSM 14728 TaxID=1121451 RepID=L0RCR5_9BACT|nr:zinc ABC transporter substrate-binding protein [Maridesulfovibrio hydrothermalis]CCO23361.1 Periplasmic solute binding protein [Maridesulfovibrio hydrothermalis AM13 = DSM 14728]
MKKFCSYIITGLLILACQTAQAAPLQITVSIVPLEYFVKKIGGDLVEVNVMVRPGSSPATYEPQPRQMAGLSKADIYYAIGVPFEQAWLPRFKSANKNLDIINLGDSVVKVPMQSHFHNENKRTHRSEAGHKHNGHDENFLADPHIWLAPQLVRILSLEIKETLTEKDHANAATYTKNYFNFAREINQLDNELLSLFAAAKKRSNFMVYHPSWGYFARSYGLNQIPIELEGKDPSPKELTQIIDFARKKSVAAIFVQPQFSRKSAQAIAASIGAKVLTADPLAADWAENLRKAAKAFQQDAR